MTTQPDTGPPTEEQAIGRIAFWLARDEFPRGERAVLRRGLVAASDSGVLWRLLGQVRPDVARMGEDLLARWALVIQGMALMAPRHHDPGVPLGRALLIARVSEARVARLLASRGPAFRSQALRLARRLAAAGEPIDWRELGRLILHEERDEEVAERLRLGIARHYYAAAPRTDAA